MGFSCPVVQLQEGSVAGGFGYTGVQLHDGLVTRWFSYTHTLSVSQGEDWRKVEQENAAKAAPNKKSKKEKLLKLRSGTHFYILYGN